MWFVYFGDDIKGKLAAFTVVDLIANVSYAKVLCCAVGISLVGIAMALSDTLFAPPRH